MKILIPGLLGPVIDEQLRSELYLVVGSSRCQSLKPSHNHTSTCTELFAKIRKDPTVPRTHARNTSAGPCNVRKYVYILTGRYYVCNTSLFNWPVPYIQARTQHLDLPSWIRWTSGFNAYSLVDLNNPYWHIITCNCHLPTIKSISTDVQHDNYGTATLSTCTKYYLFMYMWYIQQQQ